MNMDYCKFENTYRALEQCLEEGSPADETERKYAKRIFQDIIDVLMDEDIIETYDRGEFENFIKNME